MAGLDAGSLNRRVYFWRSEMIDDGTATVPGEPAYIGKRWAKKTDVSDGEKIRAAEQAQEITTRFLVRADGLTRTITGKDLVRYKAMFYEVTGTKEVGDNMEGVEITAVARPDQAATSA